MYKIKAKEYELPSYLRLQLAYIATATSSIDFGGGYFAGKSKNRYYAKKQHRKFIEKHLNNKVEFFTLFTN